MLLPMNPDAIIEAFVRAPDPSLLSPFLLRLARGQLVLRGALDDLVEDPIHRALCGLDSAPDEPPSDDLAQTIHWAEARIEEGSPPDLALLAQLETRAREDLQWWGSAARLHARCSTARENQARMALGEQSIPYVFPGNLDPMQIEILAAGDCILPALHVDWVRKLSGFVLETMILDLRFSGGWFWPLLEVLEGRKAARMIGAMAKRPRKGPGALGMLGAYLTRLGEPLDSILPDFGPVDELVAAVAIVGERPGG